MRFGIHPDIPIAGRELLLWVKDGPASGLVAVEVRDGDAGYSHRARLEVRLDQNGWGTCHWRVPHLDTVHFSAAGFRLSRRVKRPPSVPIRLARALSKASAVLEFVTGEAGRAYGLGWRRKADLVRRIRRVQRRLRPLSTPRQHLRLAEEVLRIPPSVKGDVVECGCFDGGSTATLSLACAATGRRLFVCDSFEGLPAPVGEEWHRLTDGSAVSWGAGELASPGRLEGVQRNVRTYGDASVCRFVPGFFADSLPGLETDSIAMVFEDADLVSSVKDCLRHLWPKLQPGCKFYSHEPWSIGIVSMFFDTDWWEERIGGVAPGFIGSGGGGADGDRYQVPGLGYAVKGSAL